MITSLLSLLLACTEGSLQISDSADTSTESTLDDTSNLSDTDDIRHSTQIQDVGFESGLYQIQDPETGIDVYEWIPNLMEENIKSIIYDW